MTGRLLDLSRGLNGKQRITLELDGDFRAMFDKLKDKTLDIKIARHREKRSLQQNSYYHLLLTKIATELRISEPYCHNIMLRKYGQLMYIGDNVVYLILPDTDAAAKDASNFTMLKAKTHAPPQGELRRNRSKQAQ